MLEGLEISVVKLSAAISSTYETRWDSEYYLKKYIHNSYLLNNKKCYIFYQICNFIKKGIFDLSPDNYQENGIPFIRTSEIKDPKIDFSTTVYLDKNTHEENIKTELLPDDLVFTKIGAYIGDVALLPHIYEKYNFSQNVAGASLKDKSLGAYLVSFFTSKCGQLQILRSAMLSGQGKLELNEIRNYKIPIPSESLRQAILKLFSESQEKLEQSKSLYAQAENLLLEELGLKDWQPKNNLHTTKKFSDFVNSGRLDAEYYQSKYDELFKKLEKMNCKKLSEIVSIKKSFDPGSDAYQETGIPFIRVSDISKDGISETELHLSPLDFDIPELKPKKDTILFSKDGSIGIAYKVQNDLNVFTSGALLHLNIIDSKVLPDYLTLVLNSIIVKLQSERDSNGAIIQHWKPSDVEKVVIPLLPEAIQTQIATLIQQSFECKAESKKLLEEAKRMVEEEIEK